MSLANGNATCAVSRVRINLAWSISSRGLPTVHLRSFGAAVDILRAKGGSPSEARVAKPGERRMVAQIFPQMEPAVGLAQGGGALFNGGVGSNSTLSALDI
jgi:hypothetical protein